MEKECNWPELRYGEGSLVFLWVFLINHNKILIKWHSQSLLPPNQFQMLPKVEGAKSNTCKHLPVANTLLPQIILHGAGVPESTK